MWIMQGSPINMRTKRPLYILLISDSKYMTAILYERIFHLSCQNVDFVDFLYLEDFYNI